MKLIVVNEKNENKYFVELPKTASMQFRGLIGKGKYAQAVNVALGKAKTKKEVDNFDLLNMKAEAIVSVQNVWWDSTL